MKRNAGTNPNPIRCAIYTRKSSDEGLDQDFNSLDAQREAAESFIASQRSEGWVCVPTRYDDGGFTGGNMERPAVQRLMADIDAGLIDCVVVYKVDRLSRSLMDFARVLESFEKHGVSFVSVTQQFNTANSMGRLMLNVLLSFAQFEREIISERTRDKIAAAKRKGFWGGGRPVLGYDIERRPGGNRLVVNENEAEQVRSIFGFYLECGSLSQTIRRVDELRWTNKAWTTKAGRAMGGRPFNKTQLFTLLTNIVYLGKVKHKGDAYDGQHDAIVDADLFDRVTQALKANRSGEGRGSSNKYGALLKGLVRCKACGCTMIHHYASDRNRSGAVKHYRYYVCTRAQKRGWNECPGPSLPAQELERFVVDQIRSLDRDDALVAESVRRAQDNLRQQTDALDNDRSNLLEQVEAARGELRELVESGRDRNGSAAKASGLREEIRALSAQERRLAARIVAMRDRTLDEDELIGALEAFDPMWEALTMSERERLMHLLVRNVEYDAESETISVTFHAAEDETLEEATLSNVMVTRQIHFSMRNRGRREIREGPKPIPEITDEGRVPRITRLMALAIKMSGLIESGAIADQAEASRLGHVSRARMTQIMNLLLLAPDIQEMILNLPRTMRGRDPIVETHLRHIVREKCWLRQRRMWDQLTQRRQ